MKKLIIIPIFVLLGGCSVAQQQQFNVALNNCPVLKTYSKEQLMKAASELRNIPNESQLAVMLADYSKLRDACRVAQRKLASLKK
jgi:hypothetical protein